MVARSTRQFEDREFEHAPGLEQLDDELLAGIGGELGRRREHDLWQVFGDVHAVAAAFDDTQRHQALEGFAHRGASDAELLAEAALGGHG